MERGAEWASILVIIGGLIWLLAGAVVFGFLIYDLYQVGFTGGNPDDKIDFLIRVGIALYLCVISIWIVTAGFWMENIWNLRSASKIALILGILSLNIFAIIGGILGYNSREEEPKIKIIDKEPKKAEAGVSVIGG